MKASGFDFSRYREFCAQTQERLRDMEGKNRQHDRAKEILLAHYM